ncbi:metallophosphoesterase family protein [Almyronema epifaneia]|uniref:Metallophosphoesterase family protein n=1 Tax=Almyronema epifaneia S1 TaxID=2991925 RepID=A0ABW6IE87_9CYAN
MRQHLRFAIVSDPHIALPQTIWRSPSRFHLVEVSIPALEQVFEHLSSLALDCILMPGDLTQHGEKDNHNWLAQRLSDLPIPVYVVPGNHDIIQREDTDKTVGLNQFLQCYQNFGYDQQPYYLQSLKPGIWLIGLNSIAFDAEGQQRYNGYLEAEQLDWLDQTLPQLQGQTVLVMIHHNVLEHLPGQATSSMGQRYLLQNAQALRSRLQSVNALLLTGHLHVQDIATQAGLWEITTGSLVSYPHPYRIVELTVENGRSQLSVQTYRIEAVPELPNLQAYSRQWMSDRALPFMTKLLTSAPLHLTPEEAEKIAPYLKDFWAAIAAGDAQFDFAHLPQPVQQHFERFGAVDDQGQPQLIDNFTTLKLGSSAAFHASS